MLTYPTCPEIQQQLITGGSRGLFPHQMLKPVDGMRIQICYDGAGSIMIGN